MSRSVSPIGIGKAPPCDSPASPELGACVGGPSPSVEHRNLAEELPRPQPGNLEAVADDPSARAGDHERAGAGITRLDQQVARLERDLRCHSVDPGEFLVREPAEDADRAQRLDVVAHGAEDNAPPRCPRVGSPW